MRHNTLVVLLTVAVAATYIPASWSAALPQTAAPSGGLNQADLEELLGPIALYPDELLANVLAASVYPQELLAAQAYLDKGGDAKKVNEQPWESPVRTIANIPDVLKFLTENLDWTQAVGQAYIIQSTDVMKAVQGLRKKANETGALKSNEQQTVVTEGSTIIIEPADPQVIYVPQYNPQVVYVEQPSNDDAVLAGLIGFGVGVAVGACFNDNFYCGWNSGCVGWGWGGGYHGDVDIDRNTNINVGDVNIGSGNTINGGDRTNVRGGDRNTANVGREGSRWEPNSSKVDTNKIRSGGASQLEGFKGASSNRGTSQSRVPRSTTANSGRQSPGAVSRDSRPTPSQGGVKQRSSSAGATPSGRPSTPNAAAGGGARASTGNVPKPRTEAPRQQSSAARSAPAQSKPSGFSPDRGSSKASSRGSSSRSSAGRSSGGSRGGGGRGGGRR